VSGGFGWTHGIVVLVYCAAMAAVGIRLAGRQRTTDDYFLAGRSLPWLAVAMSMYASVTSAVTFMGVPGVAYEGGVSLLVVGAMSLIVAPFLARGFLPLYRRMGVTTSYEYAERRFGRPARVCAAGLFLLSRLAWLGLVIYAPSLALTVATGLPLWVSIVSIGLLSTAYTVAGGLAAVVWTDVVQFVLMVGGALWMAVALAARVDGGTAAILAVASGESLMGAANWTFDPLRMNGLAVAIAYAFILMHDYGIDQVTVQRLLAVRTSRGVTRAIAFNAVTDVGMVALLLFLGLGLHAFHAAGAGHPPPNLPPDALLPYFAIHELPAVVGGLIVAAVFAAAMSSMDSGINSIAAVIVQDFVAPVRGAALTEVSALKLARILTLALGAAATGAAFFVTQIGGMVKAFFAYTGFFSAPVLALFALGMLTRRARFDGWLPAATISIGTAIGLQRAGACHEIYLFPFSAILTFGLGLAFSLALPDRATVRAHSGGSVR
jgi:SSS family transporter